MAAAGYIENHAKKAIKRLQHMIKSERLTDAVTLQYLSSPRHGHSVSRAKSLLRNSLQRTQRKTRNKRSPLANMFGPVSLVSQLPGPSGQHNTPGTPGPSD